MVMVTIARAFGRPWEWLGLIVLLGLTFHHRWVMDDATIYYRYIDNWIFLGRGLVFNAGEYVEGFTSPLWLLLMALGRCFSLDYWSWSVAVGLACALGSGLLCIDINRRLCGDAGVVNVPLALLAGHYGVQSYYTSGLESGAVQLYAFLTARLVLTPESRWLQVALGLAPLVRPELSLVTGSLLVMDAIGRGHLPRWLFASAALSISGLLLFRIYYYADLLPNTYYLKGDVDWGQGLSYLRLEVLGALGVSMVAAAVVVGSWLRGARQAGPGARQRVYMLVPAALVTLWSVSVGGDMAYHRFLAFPFCLCLCALSGLAERCLPRRGLQLLRPSLFATALAAALSGYPAPVLSHHPLSPASASLQWNGIEDAMWHRRHSDLRYSPERSAEDEALQESYRRLPDPAHHHRRRLQAFCVWAFRHPDFQVVHTYGLTDAVLARVDAEVRRPGHRKLWHHARDLLRAQEAVGPISDRFRYRQAVELGKAAPWIVRALPTIEVIERKVRNRHSMRENLPLALSHVDRITVE